MKSEKLLKYRYDILKCINFFIFATFLIFNFLFLTASAENIKEPNVAGAFYPSEKKELEQEITGYFDQVQKTTLSGRPVVLISPHAGYIYSGPVAAFGYSELDSVSFDTVIILAPTHYFYFKGAALYGDGFFRTPLGDLKIDNSLSKELADENPRMFVFRPEYFQQEHSLEVQLPFLQKSLKPGFSILPVLLGDMTYDDCLVLAKYLAKVSEGKNILLVVSTDLSHYKSYDEAIYYDKRTIDFISKFDSKGLWDEVSGTSWNVCGIRPVVAGISFALFKNADKVNILKYANSGDTAGGKDRVVGYASILFTASGILKKGEVGMLSKDEKDQLLQIARKTIQANLEGERIPEFKVSSPGLNAHRGVFVTLRKKSALRGCIGLFTSDQPLYKVVSEMAIASSTQDYRFMPVSLEELKDITIEISCLTEPKQIDNWKNIRLGVDGVIVRKGYSSGVFLPQVATETGWDLETFMSELCAQKAGLPWDCYKDPSTKIYTFQAEVFSEEES